MKVKKRFHWLAEIINHRKFTIGAEVGAATGVTTEYLLRNCPELKKLIIVDDWRPIPGSGQWERHDMEQVFKSKFNGEKRLKIVKGISWEAAGLIDNYSLDFVFIDASHDYNSVVADLYAYIPKIRSGGMLCGHDLHFKGVKDALHNVLPSYIEAGVDNTWFKIL